mgnify:CR=1 FL=1
MKKFLVIYGMSSDAIADFMQNSTKEQQEADMKDWNEWMENNKEHMADMGNPVGKNTRLTKDSVEEISNDIAGYSIMQAESKEDLIEIIKTGPHLNMPKSYTEVMEIVEM